MHSLQYNGQAGLLQMAKLSSPSSAGGNRYAKLPYMSAYEQPSPRTGSSFATTHWSLIRAAAQSSPDARDALATLCERYWYPLYAFVRREGRQPAEAQDLTQSFFATLIEGEDLKRVRPDKGRFRSFLLASLKHFLINDWHRSRAVKRGGARRTLSLDFDSAEDKWMQEPAHDKTPEAEFARHWALTLLQQVQQTLAEEARRSGKSETFQKLKPYLSGNAGAATYRAVASELGMSEGAVKVAVHRLRQRFRDRLRGEIAQTVSTEEEIDDEIRDLFTALGGHR